MQSLKNPIYFVLYSLFLLLSLSTAARSLHLSTFSSQQGLSQNSITCSITDQQGFLWFATQGGLNRFDGYEFKRFKANSDDKSISGNWITSCVKDSKNQLWFSTASKGLNRLNPKTGQFEVFSTHHDISLNEDKIWSMAIAKDDVLWLGHENGKLTRFDVLNNRFTHFHYKSAQPLVRDIVITKEFIWLATDKGLISFDPITEQFTQHAQISVPLWHLKLLNNQKLIIGAKQGLYLLNLATQSSEQIEQFNGAWITDSLIDQQQNLWLTSYGQGLYFFPAGADLHGEHSHYRHDKQDPNGLSSDYLLSINQDSQGIIWLGTDGYGVHRYDPKQQQFSHQLKTSQANSLSHNFVRSIIKRANGEVWIGTRDGLNRKTTSGYQHFKNALPNNNIFALHEDANQQLWIGTYGGGLIKYQDALDEFAVFTMQSHQLASDRVYAITSDKTGALWLGSNQGLTRFEPASAKVTHYKHSDTQNSLANNTVFTLAYDNEEHVLWIGTRAGLNKLDIDTEQFTLVDEQGSDEAGLSHNMVTSLLLSGDHIWVGTMQGLNQVNTHSLTVKQITEQQGLANDNIFDILADKQGMLWLATNGGLTRYNPSTQQMQQFLPEDGIQHQSFILGASYQADDGELFFGGINGYNHFYPEQLNLTHAPPAPVLTELLLNNRAIKSNHFDKQTNTLASATQTFSFAKSAGVIGFKFSALKNGATPKHYQYGYKLAGFDEQFLYTDASLRQINYPQLPAGHYQLLLKAKDQYGQWSDSTQLLALTVVPPWWQTKLAYSIYFVFALALTWLVLNALYKRKLAEQEKQTEIELNKLKDQFLDNISHELKTPLSLILAPISQLQRSNADPKAQTQLASIKRNCQRLLELINQLLQLSQRPSTAIYTVSPYAITPFLTDLVADFRPLFEQKQLHFSFTDSTSKAFKINLAPEHAHSIFSNLISNALKYTPAGGTVAIHLSEVQQALQFKITDTGVGIASEHQQSVFQRFTRVASSEPGSGIGLSLVKQLVEQYGGSISVSSKFAEGSCFTVSLPMIERADNQANSAIQIHTSQPTLLIVEDNQEMAELLLCLFNTEFNCMCATDGQQALDLCQTDLPDLIISDVMMPNMDGYQLLAALRANPATSHIPVLLLSAKADTHSRLKGLDLLADDFLSKPFEPTLLMSRVKGLLNLRQILNQHLTAQLAAPLNSDTAAVTVQNKDYSFTEKLKQTVQAHYQDESFSVEQLASALCLSPRALQLKMKALYSQTPSDYLRNTRLEFAKKQLIDSALAIGQIAEQTGFRSQSYFARSFKNYVGLSPKQYREKHQKHAEFRISE
ncbi:two-component regulator propeller domain-containing protein [Pseudoalteromonas gelatinilytica]|uniref:histidine kinase n=1 Tax=Pseudoalteromonas gelatinilytica TaxID=1703256 RepID=A0A3A3EFM4_9GAMM|nr:two-component regulator propeller domain-containing protein [Pseudoalteromonas profundi]RJF31979.1 hybrid sensor histidine kinase/response regulator [Pseudoalteromonas profundi]